jgi:hypothetical protein
MNLKSLIFLILLIIPRLLFGQGSLSKQDSPKAKAKNNLSVSSSNTLVANKTTNKQKTDRLADKIIATLELDDADSKQIHAICEDRAEKIEKIKLNNDNSQQKIFDLQTINQDFDNRLKQLVTSNQFQKYETMRRNSN